MLSSTGTAVTSPQRWWTSPTWDATRSKLATGDYTGDGKADLGILYDYGNANATFFVLASTGTSTPGPQAWWTSPTWDATRTTLG